MKTQARGSRTDGGMVTAETAIVLPFVVAVALVLVWVVSLGVAQVRLVDAAREAARMSARGDDSAQVRAAAERMAPPGATITVESRSGETEVGVGVDSRIDVPVFKHLPRVHLSARAVSANEDDDQ